MKLHKSLNSALSSQEDSVALKLNVKDSSAPQELFDLPKLTELYLEGNALTFPSILNWPKLKILSIKWPEFTGDLSVLFSLPALENLKIISTPIKAFYLPLGHAASPLRSLTVKDCGIESLPEEISMLSTLEEMSLSGNRLKTLPASFGELIRLKRLNLDSNAFENFPDIIKKAPKLIHLSIDNNHFSDLEKARVQRQFHLTLV